MQQQCVLYVCLLCIHTIRRFYGHMEIWFRLWAGWEFIFVEYKILAEKQESNHLCSKTQKLIFKQMREQLNPAFIIRPKMHQIKWRNGKKEAPQRCRVNSLNWRQWMCSVPAGCGRPVAGCVRGSSLALRFLGSADPSVSWAGP